MSIVESLKNEFHINPVVSQTQSGKIKVEVSSDWRGKTQGVSFVEVYLTGEDPLTGNEIPEEKYKVKFNAVETCHQLGTFSAGGDYELHYAAVLNSGERVVDFKAPYNLSLSGGTGAYIQYETVKAPQPGWTGVKLSSNCWKKCSGKLWIKYNHRFQNIPKFRGEDLVFYIAGSNTDYEIISGEAGLPTPQKKR